MSNLNEDLIAASTILLLRDGEAGLEVFMVVRHHQIDFASGALVFPGGKVDRNDRHENVRVLTDGAHLYDDRELYMRVAAIREAYEECGVLLARDTSGRIIDAARLVELEPWREKLNSGEVGIAEFCEQHGLRIAADMLTSYAHWITPKMMPKRFDTLFYLAVAPDDHVAVHDGTESVDSVWIRPQDALDAAAEGTRTVIFPTRMNILKLARYATSAEAIEIANATAVVTVEPQVEKRGDKGFLVIPEEAGYGVTEEPLEAVANVMKAKS